MEKLGIKTKILIIVALLLFAHLAFLVWTKFTAWPEMLTWPYLINNGLLPYRNIAMAHNPLLVICLSVFYFVFGTGIIQLKIFTWILILATDLLVFFVAKKFYGTKGAIISTVFYVLLNLTYEGNGLWFDLALAPLCLLVYYTINKKWIVISGALWAIAFLTKQTALWFLVPIVYSLVQQKSKITLTLVRFCLGSGGIFLVFFLLLIGFGLFEDYYRWAIDFGMFKLPTLSGQIQFPSIKHFIGAFLPLVPLAPIILSKRRKELALWIIFLILGFYPRWELFHFQPALPFLALVYGASLSSREKSGSSKYLVVAGALSVAFIFTITTQKNFREPTRFYDASILKVVEKIDSLVEPKDKIYVVNYPDNLYPLTNTLPGVDILVPHLEWYLEQAGIQDELINDLQLNKVELIVVGQFTQTGLSSYKPKAVSDFLFSEYEVIENVENVSLLRKK